MTSSGPDILGPPYTAETLTLPDDDEGSVVATLVHRPAAETTDRAVLHVHGFADYFFQTAYAEWWTERGYDFYALDLRKYGRSILPHQTPNYVADLAHYHPELDLAWDRVTAGPRPRRPERSLHRRADRAAVGRRARARRRRASSSTRRGSTCRVKCLGPARAHAGRASRSRSGSRCGPSPAP